MKKIRNFPAILITIVIAMSFTSCNNTSVDSLVNNCPTTDGLYPRNQFEKTAFMFIDSLHELNGSVIMHKCYIRLLKADNHELNKVTHDLVKKEIYLRQMARDQETLNEYTKETIRLQKYIIAHKSIYEDQKLIDSLPYESLYLLDHAKPFVAKLIVYKAE